MKSRSLLVALTLLASVQLGRAQCPTQCSTLARQAAPDTLITLTEDELVAGLRAIAEAYRTKGHTPRHDPPDRRGRLVHRPPHSVSHSPLRSSTSSRMSLSAVPLPSPRTPKLQMPDWIG